MLRPSRWTFVGCLTAVCIHAGALRADPPTAEASIERGIEYRRLRNDSQALVEFRRAYAASPSPRALAQIALAEAALGEWVSAEVDLLRALAADDEWTVRQRPALKTGLDQIAEHLGTLEIGGPEGTEVWIDGVEVAQLPRPALRALAKHIAVEFRSPGFQTLRREVDLSAGAAVRVDVVLEPVAAPLRQRIAQGSDAPALVLRPDPPPAKPTRVAAWASAAGSVLLAGAGVAFTLYSADRAARYAGSACEDLPGVPRSERCASVARALHQAEVAEWIAYFLSCVSGASSVALFLSPPSISDKKGQVHFAPSLSSMTLRYSF
jgi:hypothetical protein